MKWVTINKGLVRRVIHSGVPLCDWCAEKRPSGGLFQYGIKDDNDNVSVIRGAFCSKSCAEMLNRGPLVKKIVVDTDGRGT